MEKAPKFLLAICLTVCVQALCAQVIPFSMDAEQDSKNTPEGWTEVRLPQNLPAITEANTFYITAYGASTSSADNTQAIQNALNAAASAGGGMVVVPEGTWMFGRIQVGSKTILHLCAGATLKLLAYADQPDHTTKEPYITGKSNASDIVIEGESKSTSIIEGQGGPWWDAVEQKVSGLQRGSIIRFYQGNRYLFRNFRIQNAPSTNLTLGNSGKGMHNTVHDVSIYAPSSHADDPSHNTDGIPIWAAYANIYNCDIDTGDDNVVTDSNAQFIHVWNCNFKAGHGASLGSYTQNMHDIIYEGITFDGTDCGFRLKSNTDRSGDVYNLVFRNCTMTNVMSPVQITAWYDTLPDSPAAAAASPEPVITTTPQFRDILIQNVTATGYTGTTTNPKNGYGIFIYGRPESLVKNVTFDNVQISHSKGLKLNFCEGIQFINSCSVQNTKTGAASTQMSVAVLIEEQYQCSYTWNGFAEDDITSVTLDKNTCTLTYDKDASYVPYTFNNGYTITNGNNKAYAPGGSTTIKYSAGTQYTISGIPSGKGVYSITFKGYGNNDDKDSYLQEVNGQQYGDSQYVFVKRKNSSIDTANPTTYSSHTITFDQLVKGSLTFTPAQAQACFIITMEVGKITSTGIDDSTLSRQPTATTCYDLQGRRVSKPGKGLYIVNGKKILF